MKKEIIDFFASTFLFSRMTRDEIGDALKKIQIHTEKYPAKTYVFQPQNCDNRLCFIKSGECTVEHLKSDGGTLPLNKMGKFNSFGILSVLSEEERFPTAIITSKVTEIIYLTQEDTLNLIYSVPAVAMNVISFLAKKVAFLNDKIATFSSDSVEEKLANFLMFERKKLKADEFDFNAKRTAEAISAGRASLYRAITALTNDGLITLLNKKIYIHDPTGLERRTK